MPNNENQELVTYQSLIKEVYIDPIRSAVLIDDDFPTLEEYINGKNISQNNTILKSLLKTCRETPNQWLVDVHNGKKQSVADANVQYEHLHHSDLMILDYHLDGDDTNTKAMEILRSLASTNYFNMVVVYTKGTPKELEERVLEIVHGLTSNFHGDAVPIVPDDVIKWDLDDEDISAKLKKELNTSLFLQLMQERDVSKTDWKELADFKPFLEIFSARQNDIRNSIDSNAILDWLVKEKIISSKKPFSTTNFGKVEFCVHNSSNRNNWIRTNNLFVTVIAKSTNASEIPKMLLDALTASDPSPHRLLMAKMRNCLDNSGVSAEAAIIRKGNIQAGLLWQMLHAKPNDLPWKLQETIERHWEQLATAIENEIHKYGMRLFKTVQNEHEKDKIMGINKYTKINLSQSAGKKSVTSELNSFICSRKPSGVHLIPGQILCVIDDNQDRSHWICLSPACDLVPAQNKGKWRDQEIMQFTAVKLWPINSPPDSEKINTNEYLFLEISGDILCFCYRKTPRDNPVSEQFFAKKNGLIVSNKIQFLSINDYNIENGKMESKLHEAEIVSQLRYEYAINLMQKLGSNLTRVGLDFVSII
jgi:hypothetical protein